ncbi:hypothetical protein V8E55_004599 [Tylopilus felleus]
MWGVDIKSVVGAKMCNPTISQVLESFLHSCSAGQQHTAALAQQGQQHNTVIQCLNILQECLEESQQQLPMLLCNATTSYDAPLVYLLAVGNVAGLPVTKGALLMLTVANYIALAEALGLHALPAFPAPIVIIRQQQILNFLGCVIRAQ